MTSQLKFDSILGGGFKYFLVSPLFGEDSHFDPTNQYRLPTIPLCAGDLDLNVRGAIGLRIPVVVIHEGTGGKLREA